MSVLRAAKIETADCLLSMCNEDTLNLMVTQVAKYIFGVPKVIARVYEPSYESMFRKFGIESISPIQLALEAFLDALGLDRKPGNEEVFRKFGVPLIFSSTRIVTSLLEE
ncbi:MAG: hypothetical protein BA865_15690 [Desulfobacterales bacterium S5133MH4]|nr:MAG: hypothetical protein BA865_15690 [Desulfobacterales bacterium S5133MH4]